MGKKHIYCSWTYDGTQKHLLIDLQLILTSALFSLDIGQTLEVWFQGEVPRGTLHEHRYQGEPKPNLYYLPGASLR